MGLYETKLELELAMGRQSLRGDKKLMPNPWIMQNEVWM